MRSLKDIPIQRKLLNVILLSCAVVVFLMGTAYMLFEYFTYRNTLKSQVATLSAVVAANSTSSLAFADPDDANEVLSAFKEEKHIVAACLYNKDGKILAKYPANTPDSVFPSAPTKRGFAFKDNHLQGFQTVVQEKRQLGMLYIRSDLNGLYEQLKKFCIVALLLFFFSLLVAYIISQVLQKSISGPIVALEQTTRIISEERNYSVRAKKYGSDEVGSLTDAFNQMLGTLESQNSEITAFNQQLEQKINDRTSALEKANETLRRQNEFVETIINSSVDVIAVFDNHMNYVMLNDKARDFYDSTKENLIGKNLVEAFPQLKDSPMVRDLAIARAGMPVSNLKYKSSILDRYFENYYIPLKDQSGAVYGVLTVAHDVTTLMESNEKLASVNTALLKSNSDLEQFAYIASHDLQEPLRKIQVFTQLLGENVHDADLLMKYQEKISQSANRMQELIQDVLNFSKISRAEDAFIATDLNQVIANLKNDFELRVQEMNAEIICDELPEIQAIPLQISQLFSNLISNALKYNDKTPQIQIRTKKLQPAEIVSYTGLDKSVEHILITFRDNGIGFDQKYNEQIFTIFQRLHGRQSYSGTGIGLAICRKIVENHNGVIYANGYPGEGAEFNIIMPVDHSKVNDQPAFLR